MENKAILMSIRPQYVAKILNGEKTIEVRKKFPKDYVGWVYIYCTKGKEKLYDDYPNMANGRYKISKVLQTNDYLNGKVVARFWCDKVEHFEFETLSRDMDGYWWDNGKPLDRDFLKKSCLDNLELRNYIGFSGGYAIHISKLEVFDKAKKLKEFYKVGAEEAFKELEADLEEFKGYPNYSDCGAYYQTFGEKYRLQNAPQSWCYIEEE